MLAKVYASSAIFLFPSTSETYGNVVVEAMASGCIPVIARGGGSQALVVDGVNGFLCSPNEPDDYLIKMKRLLRDETLRAKMQSAGLQYTSNLSWDNLAREYFTDIENLANLALSVHEKKCI
jgi:glycosyltransferase involved in cell wall biosynthesis